ncbi:phosphomethylpyrimidine synthase ThiC [Methanoregula sp.]|uniref:phosphomethylpyrimidine synthase ThiC n=1 Tax=Methanoregula sp. TaxID=2052170 RepID=UPI00236D0129|nr:phosphomethylpyrimidine synthase ThiC [Methanoregula sp.]MDD1685549.1 phosphomethylpyrimidine synthase ThiC [Methanoregula sp.]
MKTQVEYARDGTITRQMKSVAKDEGVDPSVLCNQIAEGSVVIMRRGKHLTGIGSGLRTKINVNLGTSTGKADVREEIQKARIAEEFGADTISDLSMGGDINAIRREIFAHTTLPVTTVPVYQAVIGYGLREMTADDILSTLKMQATQGISSVVVHCVTRQMLAAFKKKRRVLGMVSKGGSITSAFMLMHDCKNPFVEHFDEILSVCRKYDIVLSLGNTARNGCIHDQRDAFQLAEIRQNIVLAHRALDAGVQVIIEGAGGHIRSDRIASMIHRYKKRSPFPLFVAGPLPTDIAVGYDHIAGAIGGSAAAAAGADYLCYITPAEHLGLPGPDAVKEGLIAFRIAAHIGDTVKYGKDMQDWEVAVLRADLDREGQIRCAMDPARARELTDGEKECTMCGEFCAIKIMREFVPVISSPKD